MEAGTRQKIQLGFLVVFILLIIRVGLIWKERHDAATETKPAPASQPVSSDAYVVPPKLYAYDLASAKAGLEGKTIWVAAGNQVNYYRVHGGAVDWKNPVGTLPPMDALHIQKVAKIAGPVERIKQGDIVFHKVEQHVAAIFKHGDARTDYAVDIGSVSEGSYRFNVDGIFFLEDPHQLYKHWSTDVWRAIESHQAIKGMNELQTSLALGPGKAVEGTGNDYGERTLQYESNGKTITVTFSHDHATEIKTT